VSAQKLEAVYLIAGTDLPKVALALRRLRSRFEEGSVERLSAESASGAEAVAATNALGLFGGGERLVVIEEIERWKKADVAAVAAYLESPTPGAVLALAGDPSRLEGLADACARAGSVLRYDVPKKRQGRRDVDDFAAFVQKQFEQAGVRVDHDAATRLVEIVHEDTLALGSEVVKIVTWAGGDSVGVAEIERLATPSDETATFALVDSWGRRDAASLLSAVEADRRLGVEPFVIVAKLGEYVRRARAIKALLDQDVGVRAIAERLSMKEFPARKQADQVAGFGQDELDAAVIRLAELDLALKGGSRVDPALELERALIQVTDASGAATGG
jgi:DNA polymerase III delta subunit